MIPGVLSPETVVWCAEHKYPYLGLGTALPSTAELWNLYGDVAAKQGYEAGYRQINHFDGVWIKK